MLVTAEDVGNIVILHCAGRLVRGEETSVLCAAIHLRGRNIAIDLSNVDGIDAAGVGALLALQAADVYLKVLNPSTAVREVLRITKLESVLEIVDQQASSTNGTATPGAQSPALTQTGCSAAAAV